MIPIRELTPLMQGDCFTVFTRVTKDFDIPLHNHEDMELNLILNGSGAKRIVGDHTAEVGELDMVLIGSGLSHGCLNHKCKRKEVKEVTLHFHKDLLDDKFLTRNPLSAIKNMFEQAKEGVSFSKETIEQLMPRLLNLGNHTGFASVLEFLSILHELSIASGSQTLSNATVDNEAQNYISKRIEKVYDYMNAHFNVQVTLTEVAKLAGMPDASFSRFIKQRTGQTFIDSLNEIRLAHVTRMLIDTTLPIADIAYKCGFNNLANFNRTFKSKKGCTPKEFRDNYVVKSVFI
ncbi:MAG: AraC family transcriptional regulator [Sphingobacteriales bacterium]|nr:MAG: AraC family transcriptional regulator [Sphingobacteriales bacterium]